MDNLLQNRDEMQDEELYALLDKALDTERLCVSEDLIQKTLRRVAEEDNSKVISFEKAAKRKLPAVKYISVAAAALFVIVLGVGVLRGGVTAGDSVQMEAVYDNGAGNKGLMTADKTESAGISVVDNADGTMQYSYSTNGAGDKHDAAEDMSDAVEVAPEGDAVVQEDRGRPQATAKNENVLEGTVTILSAELAEALTAVGAEPGEAEYWEFVQRDTTWEKELFRELAAAMDVFGETLPESGAYSYSLECANGNGKTIYCEYPLDGIVRIETSKGVLWGLLGDTARFYTE
ncbi:MAG: hypothetical protein E7268_05360 [Lachnospiraceae bacterium]|nr:hypothetical protein [Lachnospiraceae bacterium]